MCRLQFRGIEFIFYLFLQTFLSCKLGVCTWHGYGRGGLEEGGRKRRDGGEIGLIIRTHNKTLQRDMNQMNRNIITIFLHENCG